MLPRSGCQLMVNDRLMRVSEARSTHQPCEQVLHDRLPQGAGLVGDDDLLDAMAFAEVDGANTGRFGLMQTQGMHDGRAGFALHQVDGGVTGWAFEIIDRVFALRTLADAC